MTTFITGGAGFIGSNFTHYLSSKGYEDVIIVDKLTYASNKDNLYPLEYPLEQMDISNRSLSDLFERYKPKNIFHFAAETHVDKSISDPDSFIQSNILGTVHLLNLAVEYGVERFHHISTDEVYGSLDMYEQSFTEKTAYDPLNPYSASKAASDHFVQAYNNTYGLPTIITNCSNNYGPRQHVEKLIPKTISNILEGKKIPVYGVGENIRDWIYVEDHSESIFNVFNNGKIGE